MLCSIVVHASDDYGFNVKNNNVDVAVNKTKSEFTGISILKSPGTNANNNEINREKYCSATSWADKPLVIIGVMGALALAGLLVYVRC